MLDECSIPLRYKNRISFVAAMSSPYLRVVAEFHDLPRANYGVAATNAGNAILPRWREEGEGGTVKVVSQGAIGGTAEACHTLPRLLPRRVYAT